MSSETSSSNQQEDDTLAAMRSHPQYRDVIIGVQARKDMVVKMTEYARSKMLDVTVQKVDRHYDWFKRWYEGGLATGYLINRLGLKQIGGNK